PHTKQDAALFDVFPIGGVQSPREKAQQAQEQQDPRANLLALLPGGFGHPDQVRREVSNRVVIVIGRHSTGSDLLKSNNSVFDLTTFIGGILELRVSDTLQLP